MTRIYGLDADIYFGDVDKPLPDWRNDSEWMAQEDPDDELEPGDPNGAIAILGYDPFEEEEGVKGGPGSGSWNGPGDPRFASGGGSGGRESFGTGAEALHQIHLKEKEIIKSKVEIGVLFDENGKVLLSRKGKESEVSFTSEELEQFQGKILTHNHPPSTFESGVVYENCPPSPDDAAMMLQHGLKQLRTVTKDYVFTVEPGRLNGDIVIGNLIGSQLNTTMLLRVNERTQALVEQVRKGKIPNFIAQKRLDSEQGEIIHKVWKEVAKNTGIGYKREERVK